MGSGNMWAYRMNDRAYAHRFELDLITKDVSTCTGEESVRNIDTYNDREKERERESDRNR